MEEEVSSLSAKLFGMKDLGVVWSTRPECGSDGYTALLPLCNEVATSLHSADDQSIYGLRHNSYWTLVK